MTNSAKSELQWPPPDNATRLLDGEGVLVGVVDISFDADSPAFGDGVVGVWDQTAIRGGREHSSGFGRVFNESESWAARFCQPRSRWQEMPHGTQVAMIAAGREPKGFAPAAHIAAVVAEEYERVAEAISWIFEVADELNMPAVVNLSLRRDHFGPHDGSDLVSAEIDAMAGPGRLIVAAAGNEGGLPLHAQVNLQARDTACLAITTYGAPGLPARVGVYSRTNDSFRIRLLRHDSRSRDADVLIDWLDLGEEDDVEAEGWSIVMATGIASREASAGISFFPGTEAGGSDWLIELEAIESDVMVDLWSADNYAQFGTFVADRVGFIADGLEERNMVASPAVARSAIAVGAECQGELAEFSNLGPTVDGRLKPEVVVPGCDLIVGAHAGLEGTSYSAPILTGILACLLEAAPKMDPDSARSILRASSLPLDPASSDGWGFGRVVSNLIPAALMNTAT